MIEIIPAIDLINGQCVRLTQGRYEDKKVYRTSPVEVAREYEAAGIKRLHLVDLDGAKAGKIVNASVLKAITDGTSLTVDFGGGVRTDEDLKIAFDSGAQMITAGSIAVKSSELVLQWIEKWGADCIILGADVKDGKVAIHGWQQASELTLNDLVEKYRSHGISKLICTDVSKDGAMIGPNFELYNQLKEQFPEIQIIASGGVRDINDVKKLNDNGIDSVIIGKAIYEGKISLGELAELC